MMSVLSQTFDRQSNILVLTAESMVAFQKQINQWKADNTVQKRAHKNWIYNADGTVNNYNGTIPEGKTVSNDVYNCDE